jgi:hypothetical protein
MHKQGPGVPFLAPNTKQTIKFKEKEKTTSSGLDLAHWL